VSSVSSLGRSSLTRSSSADVATQSSSKWSLAQWAYYYKTGIPPTADTKSKPTTSKREPDTTAAMQKVYNVISLECTGTELAKLVVPPRLVKEVDWVDGCWPDSRKKRKLGHVNFDPKTTKADVVTEPTQTAVSSSKANAVEPARTTASGSKTPLSTPGPQAATPDIDDPMNSPPAPAAQQPASAPAEQEKQPADGEEPIDDESVAGKRKLDGDGWPKVKLYCLMGKAGSWTVSERMKQARSYTADALSIPYRTGTWISPDHACTIRSSLGARCSTLSSRHRQT
jgi:hypothetical protein